MPRVDFDQYAGQYEAIIAAQTNFFDGDSDYFARYKIELARQLVGSVDSVLDFGCGVGRSMPHLRAIFPKAGIVGCDPSVESLAIARGRTRAAASRRLRSSMPPPNSTW